VPELVETSDCLEVASPMPAGWRLLLVLLSLVPLLAPYELLIRVEWSDYFHPFFLLAAMVSAGAVALSVFFLFAAAAGLSSRMRFDRTRSTFTYSAVAPVVPSRTRTYPLASIERIEIEVHDWSDGAPSYSLKVVMSDRRAFSSASSWSQEEIERIKGRVAAFLTSLFNRTPETARRLA